MVFAERFVAAHQQVGDFKVVKVQGRLQKNGGNVAGYFCTPEGRVIHATAGPVTPDTFLDAARWAVDQYERLKDLPPQTREQEMSMAHRLQASNVRKGGKLAAALGWTATWKDGTLTNEQRVHMLVAERPLPPLSSVYRDVFNEILNEDIRLESPNLVLAERALALAERTHRPMLFVLHDSSPHSKDRTGQRVRAATRLHTGR